MKNSLKNNTLYIFAAILPLIIAGCGVGQQQDAQKPKNFKISHLQPDECDFKQTQNNITLRAKLLQTQQECIDLFGKNGKNLLKSKKKKIYPIKFTVENKTNQKIFLLLENINLKQASRDTVFNKIKSYSSWSMGAATLIGCEGAATLGFFGIITGIAPMGAGLVAASNVGVACLFLTPVLAIGGVIAAPLAALYYNKINTKLRKKVKKTCATTFKPSKTKTFLLFVKKRNYKQNFVLSLSDENQKKLTFNIKLPEIKI